jgi:hypothetical protein
MEFGRPTRRLLMNKIQRWLAYGEDRLIEKIDRKKAKIDARRGSVKKGRIIRNNNGTIRRVVVA